MASKKKTWTVDTNADGLQDEIHVSISVPVLNNENIHGIRFGMEIQYELFSTYRLISRSLVHFDASFPVPAAKVAVQGDIVSAARVSLPAWKDSTVYNVPVLNFTRLEGPTPNALTWDNIMSEYAARDVRTTVSHLQTSWTSGRARGEPVLITARFNIPQDRIFYQPGQWEVLKHGWIQYLSYFILTGILGWLLMAFLLQSQVLVATEEEPWTSRYAPLPEKASALNAFKY
jgi:hypothetical protein